ncbi:hypothetical protein QTP88_002923 [Uroleucon formosanum]
MGNRKRGVRNHWRCNGGITHNEVKGLGLPRGSDEHLKLYYRRERFGEKDRIEEVAMLSPSLKIPTQLLILIGSFLQQIIVEVRINDTSSSTRLTFAGLPQGSCLFPQLLQPTNYATKILQKQIDLASIWYKEWKITINPSKTTMWFYMQIKYHFTPKMYKWKAIPLNGNQKPNT